MSKKVLLFLVLLFGIFSINVNGVYAQETEEPPATE